MTTASRMQRIFFMFSFLLFSKNVSFRFYKIKTGPIRTDRTDLSRRSTLSAHGEGKYRQGEQYKDPGKRCRQAQSVGDPAREKKNGHRRSDARKGRQGGSGGHDGTAALPDSGETLHLHGISAHGPRSRKNLDV
ncbi:MAG: hypothetical protein IJH47_06120 [Oscillospiraceae bacterium]|nr:hypothetical protein [Oscillospiraceae bacterium]